LGFGPADIPRIEAVFRDLCASPCEHDDGIRFQAETVRVLEIRKETNDAGLRVILVRLLAGAQCTVPVAAHKHPRPDPQTSRFSAQISCK
jgi:hypothetical protein